MPRFKVDAFINRRADTYYVSSITFNRSVLAYAWLFDITLGRSKMPVELVNITKFQNKADKVGKLEYSLAPIERIARDI